MLAGFADQLSNPRVGAYRFDEHDTAGIQLHAVGAMQFLAPLNQHILRLVGVRIRFGNNVVDIRQHWVRSTVAGELSLIQNCC